MDKRVEAAPFLWVEEFEGQLCAPIKTKRKYRSKKKEFVGWGSKQLIEFLETIGKDTSKQLRQYDVAAIITDYVNVNNLHHPQKKKRINCDEKLHSLFGRKTIGRNKIHDLLGAHFAENQEESDDDFFYSSEEKEENNLATCEQHNFSASEKKIHPKKIHIETPKSCFAAIVPDNIKLVYLRKSLVTDLLKDPETFEGKIKGSFIRIKSDPNDFLQKNSHQLQQVTGLKVVSGTDDMSKEIFLQVSNSIKDIHICMLSEDNFSEEECKDLHRRMKDGLLKKPTIEDLEQKAQILHADITKHWLSRELALLQNLIDRANEKGWRKELYEYLERRKLLQTPSEQSRLLSEVPKVVAEEMEGAATLQDLPDKVERQNGSPRSMPRGASETPVCDIVAKGNVSTWISAENQCNAFNQEEQRQSNKITSYGKMQLLDVEEYENSHGMVDKQVVITQVMEYEGSQAMVDKQVVATEVMEYKGSQAMVDKQVVPTQVIEHEGFQGMVGEEVVTSQVIEPKSSESLVNKKVMITEVIDLSDDDEENYNPSSKNQIISDHPESMIWHYADPQGDVQGPFSLSSLKRWSDANYFPPDFKVWKKGQNKDETVLLSHILRQVFPN